MIWSATLSPHWAEVDYDPAAWLFLPSVIPEGHWPDAESWAADMATACWQDSGLRHRRKDVRRLAGFLLRRQLMVKQCAWAHQSFLHLPHPQTTTLPVFLGIWRAEGDRDQALRFYVNADDPALDGPPRVEEFATDHLGTGLRAFTRVDSATFLSYAWRSEPYDTDLVLFTLDRNPARIDDALADLDALARTLHAVPDPLPDEPAAEDSDFRLDLPSYRQAMDHLDSLTPAG